MKLDGKNLFEDSEGRPTLRDSIVLYIDELGTSQSLAELTDVDLRQVLEDHRQLNWFLHSPEMAWNQRSARFSDNTVVGAPVNDEEDGGTFAQVLSAAMYQCNLAVRGRFLRGGLARGPLYIADGYVTGQGLVTAVKLEEREAIFPRVLIDRKLWIGLLRAALPDADPFDSSVNRMVVVDGDGELFVNYLGALEEDSDDSGTDYVGDGLERHRQVVEERLLQHAGNERVRRKYAWVAQYHNWVCSEAFYGRPDKAVTGLLDFESAYPRRMSLLVPEPHILDGKPGRPPKK